MDRRRLPGGRSRTAALAALLALAAAGRVPADDRPSILWITAEDMSPDLRCYGERYAVTPHLDRLARESVRYTRAFATAPVCSPARSCLITGLYATSLGTQHLRSAFPVPRRLEGFPALLRRAGYYTSNNVKTDYNTANEDAIVAASWDACSERAHWRGRRPGQPFFAVFNLMETHQSRSNVWSREAFEKEIARRLAPAERHDPARAPVPPYYPDTPTVRRTLARYHDCVTAMDREIGRILAELESDGLADDTIVFFYSDHGAGLPRGKRVLHDSGMRVPLLVRFPEKHRSLAPAAPGETIGRLVSFVDFAPTVLRLAGVQVPLIDRRHGGEPLPATQGWVFLGAPEVAPRGLVFGARDRVDEAFDLARSVRDERYLYIRNYMPHRSWMQPERYSDAADIRRELARLAAEGKLEGAQLPYASPTRPLEELYDTDGDPHQLRNLAASSEHREALVRLRAAHRRWVLETRDLGFLPEEEAWRRSSGETPWAMAADPERYPLERILAAADLVGRPDAVPRQQELLSDPDAAVRYWAAVGLGAAGERARGSRDALQRALEDRSGTVRVEAAATLAGLGAEKTAIEALARALESASLDVVLRAARALELLGETARPAMPAMERALASARAREGEGPLFLFVRFSLEAALERLAAGG